MEWRNPANLNFNAWLLKPFTKVIGQINKTIACCRLCRQQATVFNNLCQTCFNDLPLFNYQVLDGNLLNWPAVSKALPNHQFDYLVCAAPYLWPFDQWLSMFKYHKHYELAHLLAEITAYQWQQQINLGADKEPQVVTSIPLHFNKWQQRGYNQAHLLAKIIAKKLKLPYLPKLINRIKATEQQVGQTGAQRRRNLKGAFALSDKIAALPQHIILVDDVVTTGTTANEICKLLKRQGVETVTLLTVCLTLP